ncbi:hypothetical protein SAMN02745126_05786 [Enhydrobacter aerosaccus]|uniref:Uncharacterized protein n=1 Tax=Enhydrobacter aerosaccus TaxID=225324 RepID=A0A1T4T713_9HYPH|nr:hypothetical protein [Enhydrobacter aerosaccus]SKA36217.1 hypothetical protein SAMN02745126_05786 [Enhydrobacter aerosaccus]
MVSWLCCAFNVGSALAVIGALLLLIRKARIQFSPGNIVSAFQHHHRINARMLLLYYSAAFFQVLRFVAESSASGAGL